MSIVSSIEADDIEKIQTQAQAIGYVRCWGYWDRLPKQFRTKEVFLAVVRYPLKFKGLECHLYDVLSEEEKRLFLEDSDTVLLMIKHRYMADENYDQTIPQRLLNNISFMLNALSYSITIGDFAGDAVRSQNVFEKVRLGRINDKLRASNVLSPIVSKSR